MMEISCQWRHCAGHHLHGLAGMPSNSSKSSAKQDFLQFIDNNSQPNGQSADSASTTHYLLPNFRTIQTPKKGVCNYDERVTQSLVGEFNRVQNENERQTISNYSGSEWLKHERPKHAIYYKDSGQTRSLSASKLDHLRQMCSNFIPEDRHIDGTENG